MGVACAVFTATRLDPRVALKCANQLSLTHPATTSGSLRS